MSGSTRALAAAVIALAGGLTTHDVQAATEHGAIIIEGADKVEAGRYRVPKDKDWDKTIRQYRTVYGKTPGIIFRMLATPPEVKAIHIENTRSDRTWEGINIYETGGDIFVYVIKADAEKKPAKAGKPSQNRSKSEKRGGG